MIIIRRIVGQSMEPTLAEGSVVIARKKAPNVGDIVIANVGGRSNKTHYFPVA